MFRTLIVDDREIFIRELNRLDVWGENSGFEVAGKAADGAQALDILRTGRYDLVITDIRMPKIDGIRLLQQIKIEGLCPCVVLLSEYSEFEYARRGLVLGAFDYLVKPTQKQIMAQMLTRVSKYLQQETQAHTHDGAMEHREELLPGYPIAEEKNIISLIGTQNERIPALFFSTAGSVIQLLGADKERAVEIIRRLYINIVSALFKQYEWLKLYTCPERYEKPAPCGRQECPGACRDALIDLLHFIGNLFPSGVQGLLREICTYILESPESDISLSSVADKFYINHTYLSNTFRQKTGQRFNDYVTSVRMVRARFLLEHSDMKIYEISSCLGYRDADYFNRLFKKYNGTTPTDCRKIASSE